MYLKELYVEGFKSFGKPVTLSFPTRITGIVGPNGSGKSNVTEAFRFVLGEQSMKSLRGKRGKDLIFNGGNDARQARRGVVRIVFNDVNHVLNDTFDEVSISRTVYQDGTNEYSINDTPVRHRDIVALFARANIGATGHHIISQGEADRILNASPEERKEMLEDGLGLKLLQYRRNEAEKKLNHAEKHIAETDLLLREITPHMRHLKRQVDRYEQARNVRQELESLYAEYIVREVFYLTAQKKILEDRENQVMSRLKELEKKLSSKEQQMTGSVADKLNGAMHELQENLVKLREKKDAVARNLGRLEGEEQILTDSSANLEKSDIDRKQIIALHTEVQQRNTGIADSQRADLITYVIERLAAILTPSRSSHSKPQERLVYLQKERANVQETLHNLEEKERKYTKELDILRSKQEKNISGIQESEKLLMRLMTEKGEVDGELAAIRHGLETFHNDEEQLERELKEGAVLIGASIKRYTETKNPEDIKEEPREKQKERQRLLERKKIQLETIGTDSGEEVYHEYEEVRERITFLDKEKNDLTTSIADCRECIDRIQREIDVRFREGTKKISAEFDSFFRVLFNGGHASLALEKRIVTRNNEDSEESDDRIGVVVKVSLPRKKIRSLEQLSGGERALVSIALLFAISQVTPPPFLVLDETDAALDEANSRRYVSMIEMLAKRSQLILVTHNRETMHCAGALYGVTMNSNGVSTLLSVQFDEAVQVAK